MLLVHVVGVLLTFALALFWAVNHYLRKPLTLLTDATAEISLHNLGQFQLETGITRYNELKVFEQTIQEMVANLHHEMQERQQAQLEVVQLRDYLAAITNAMPSALIGVEADGTVRHWNQATERLTGLSAPQAIGRPLPDAFPLLPPSVLAWQASLADRAVYGPERRVRGVSGMERHEEITVFSVAAVGGAMIRIDDVSERVQLEQHEAELREKLLASERRQALGVLAGGVAHDLNNILGPIVGFPSLIEEILANDASGQEISEAREMLSMIQQSAVRAADVIESLQALGKRGRTQMAPLQLVTLVDSCLNTSDCRLLLCDRPQVQVSSKLDAEIPAITGNDTDLHRVVLNFVVNAIDAVSVVTDGGCIEVAVEHRQIAEHVLGYELIRAGDYGVIHVRDTGEGIPDAVFETMFEPFVTSKKGSTTIGGGGLGLAVVHSIIRDHHGFIDVKRNQDGWASTFSIYLPVASQKATKPPEELETADLRGNEQILVVDDVLFQRQLARLCLEKQGYLVLEAETGEQALTYFDKAHGNGATIDLVLLDMIMGAGLDGLDTYRRILAVKPRQKALLVSGHAPGDRVRAAQDLGAGWLSKPYHLTDLAQLVRSKLDEIDSRSHREA